VLTTIDAGRKHLGWRIRRIDRAVGASGGGRVIRGKQRSERLLVTILLKVVVRTNGPGARYGRSRINRHEPLLDVRIWSERIVFAFQDAGGTIDPAPDRDVGYV
jgi:hypothetical protein